MDSLLETLSAIADAVKKAVDLIPTLEERGKMTELLAAGFADSFRYLYPDRKDAYTWWSYMFKARERNTGWRIDYFIVSNRLAPRVRDSLIFAGTTGSDHCPVGLDLDLG